MPRSYAIVDDRIAAFMPYPVTQPEDAKCAGDPAYTEDLPEDEQTLNYMQLKCHTCPLTLACGEWGIAHELRWGIYGGMTPEERKRVREHRGQIGFDPSRAWKFGLGGDFFSEFVRGGASGQGKTIRAFSRNEVA